MPDDVEAPWVARLYVSDRTAEKLTRKHRLTVQEVEAAVLCVAGLRGVWDDHPERGHRFILEVFIRSRRVLVVLYPADDPLGGSWHLGSAYFI